jgi:glutathione S-transferase
MSYTLYGSFTSPFVRRLRLLLEGTPYSFKEVSVFEAKDAELLNKINPLNKVPVLMDKDQVIWDSRQIFIYLNSKHQFQEMDLGQENQLTAIEGAMEAGISLLLMKRSNIDISGPAMYVIRQKERMESVLNYLKPFISSAALTTWNFQTMTLYSFLDWASFREIINLEHRPECVAFLKAHAHRSCVLETQIPKA